MWCKQTFLRMDILPHRDNFIPLVVDMLNSLELITSSDTDHDKQQQQQQQYLLENPIFTFHHSSQKVNRGVEVTKCFYIFERGGGAEMQQ